MLAIALFTLIVFGHLKTSQAGCNSYPARCNHCFGDSNYCIDCDSSSCWERGGYDYRSGAGCGDSTCSQCHSTCTYCWWDNDNHYCYDYCCNWHCAGTRGDNVCTTCVTGATLTGNRNCNCNSGWNADPDNRQCCIQPCAACWGDGYHHQCDSCSSGYYRIYSKTCTENCPSGWSASDGACHLGTAAVMTVSFDYNVISIPYEFSWGGISDFTYSFTAYGPWPADKRGYYFTGSTGGTTVNSYRVSPHFTLNVWLRPKVSSGVFFSRTNVKMGLTSGRPYGWVSCSGQPYYHRNAENIQATGPNSIQNGWHYVSIEVWITGGGLTGMNLRVDNTHVATVYSSQHTKLEDVDEIVGIGQDYTGFLFYMRLYNHVNGYYDDNYNVNSAPGILSSCERNQYIASDGSCQSCHHGCDICINDDHLCNQCFDLVVADCTTHSGPDKYNVWCVTRDHEYYDRGTDSVQNCDAHCKRCLASEFHMCCECDPGYFWINYYPMLFCQDHCPTGYTADAAAPPECRLSYNKTLDVQPHDIYFRTDDTSSSGIPLIHGSNGLYYPYYEDDDPAAALYRGRYYDGSSYSMLTPNTQYASPRLVLSTPFTVSMWFRPMTGNGGLIDKFPDTDRAPNTFLRIELANYQIKATVGMESTSTQSHTFSPSLSQTEWSFIALQGQISSNHGFYLTLYTFLSTYNSGDLEASWLEDITDDFYFYLGVSRSTGTSLNNFLQGFIWSFTVFNTNLVSNSDLIDSTCSGCSYCPLGNGSTCLSTCNIDNFPDGSGNCYACNSDCTEGCVRNDVSCNLCTDIRCWECDDFTTQCLTCKDNASIDHSDPSSTCECLDYYYWDPVLELCEPCSPFCIHSVGPRDIDCTECSNGKLLTGNTCHSYCPTGFYQSGLDCLQSDLSIFHLQPSKIEGIVYDFEQNLSVLTGITSAFYPDYDNFDPYPARYRGYYFHGNSVMQLPPNAVSTSESFVLNSNFTISVWVLPKAGEGHILTKQSTPWYEYSFVFSLDAYKPKLTMVMHSGELTELKSYTSPTTLSSTAWQAVTFTLSIGSDNVCRVYCYVNGASDGGSTFGSFFFDDVGSSYKVIIGGAHASEVDTFHEFFTGFIYSLKAWNSVQSSSVDMGSCAGCSCPTSNSCIPTCTIDEYVSGSNCYACHADCTQGCIDNAQGCNLCENVFCLQCDDYTGCDGVCIDNASGATCACDSDAVYFEGVCQDCFTGCSGCSGIGFEQCTGCKAGYYYAFGICRDYCPSGYYTSGSNCYTLGGGLVIDFSPHNIYGEWQDSLSNWYLTGDTNQFYYDYEDNDPIAAYGRGYYFHGGSIVKVSPYQGHLTPTFNFGPDVTFDIWLHPQANGAVLVKKSASYFTNILKISIASNKVRLDIKLEEAGDIAMSCDSTIAFNSWTGLTLRVDLSGGNTVMRCYHNGVGDSNRVLGYGWFEDTKDAYILTIGAERTSTVPTNYFTGFIYSLTAYNTYRNPSYNTNCYGSCSACPGSFCLPNCDVDEYQTDAYNENACSSCHEDCPDGYSCRTAGASCNLCSDPECLSCSAYSGSCTECKEHASSTGNCGCDSKYYYDTDTEQCELCDSSCETCTWNRFYDCTSCATTYSFLNQMCHRFCPTGYVVSGSSCVESYSPAFKITLDAFDGVVQDSSSTGIEVLTGTRITIYPYADEHDPTPVKNRGYYFDGSSSLMQLPPNSYSSNPLLLIGNEFTIAAWVYHTADGVLLSKQNVDNTISLQIAMATRPVLTLNIQQLGQITYTCSFDFGASWNVLIFTVGITSSGSQYAKCQKNGSVSSTTTLGTGFFRDLTTEFTFLIGASKSSSNFANFWGGMLYSLEIYNKETTPNVYRSSCSGCSYCPYDTNTCLTGCAPDHYLSGSTCYSCDSMCDTCVRDDFVCNLCDDRECKACSSHAAGACEECVEHATLSSGYCECDAEYTWSTAELRCVECDVHCPTCVDGSFFGCTSCKSPYYWHQGICFSQCPTGYTPNSSTNSCDVVFTQLLDYEFNTPYGYITSSNTLIEIKTGSTNSFYPTPDDDDPWPVYGRGYYFHGSSVIHLPPHDDALEYPLVLSPESTISGWIRPKAASGTLFCKQSSGVSVTEYYCLKLNNNAIELTLLLADGSHTVSSGSYLISTDSWGHFVVAADVVQNEYTQFTVNINGQSEINSSHSDFFIDFFNGYLMLIGAQYTTQLSIGSYYEGYLYELNLWSIATTSSSTVNRYTSCVSNPSACSVCPTTGYCLPTCELDEYYNPSSRSCGSCSQYCPYACLSATYCTLCDDVECHSCTSYSSNSCETCKDGATNTADCECFGDNLWHYREELCHPCVNRCAECTSNNQNACTKCEASFYMAEGYCLDEFCPTGYTQDIENRACVGGNKIFEMDVRNEILDSPTESARGFQITSGSSTNFYPSYDSYDPYAAIERGYYFTGRSYMTIGSDGTSGIVFAPVFTMSMWLNPHSDGTLFSKIQSSTLRKYVMLSLSSAKVRFDTILVHPTTFLTDYTAYNINSVGALTRNTWSHLAVELSIGDDDQAGISFYFNGVLDSRVNIARAFLEDIQSSFSTRIGTANLESYYTGFLMTFNIWQGTTAEFHSEYSTTADCSGCDTCLADGTCIPDCDYREFPGSLGVCSNCLTCDSCSTCDYTCRNDIEPYCNICYDFKCKVCTDYSDSGCIECLENAVMVDGNCECASNSKWNEFTQLCDLCYPYCASCDYIETTRCNTCTSDPKAYKVQGMCLPICPTGYSISWGSCYGSNTVIFGATFSSLEGDVIYGTKTLTAGNSYYFYPNYDNEDPFAAKDRGYYFNGESSVMHFGIDSDNNNNQLVFTPEFSLSYWLKPEVGSTTIMSRQQYNQEVLFKVALTSDGSPQFTVKLEDNDEEPYVVTCSQPLQLNAWNFLGLTLQIYNYYSRLTCYIDETALTPIDITTSHFLDMESSYSMTLGAHFADASTLTEHFQGFIYEFYAWNYAADVLWRVATACGSGCQICPSARVSCLSECSFDYFFNGAECEICHEACEYGCVRSNDCRLCESEYCDDCEQFDTCIGCVENGILGAGTCECERSEYVDDVNQHINCCYVGCDTCTGDYNGDCTACAALYYMSPQMGICLTKCPIGYYESGRQCVAENANALVVHFKFDKTTNEVKDLVGDYLAYMGGSDDYINLSDDPYPIYQSGYYFNGLSYAQLPPNTEDLSTIMVGNSHSMALWLRPLDSGSDHVILSKETGTTAKIIMRISSGRAASIRFIVFTPDDPEASFETVSSVTVQWNQWMHFGYTFTVFSRVLYTEIFVDGVSTGAMSLDKAFIEDDTTRFVLGYSSAQGAGLVGFIYELRIYNYQYAFEVPNTDCGCLACSEDGDCLESCNYLEVYSAGCATCDPSCSTGCMRTTDCRLNLDEKCLTSTSFLVEDCTECIFLARKTIGSSDLCECVDNAVFDQDTGECACETWYIEDTDSCAPHYYHLVDDDVSAYFAEDYYSLIIELTQSVQTIAIDDCMFLFELTTYEKLGIGATCTWNSDMNVLTIVFGLSATLLSEEMVFNAGTLYTGIVQDASNQGAVTVIPAYRYDRSVYPPTAVLVADDTVFIGCSNLGLKGSGSIGEHGRSLQYKWEFSISTISGYSAYSYEHDDISVSRSLLTGKSSVEVTLWVRNWLDNYSSASKTVEIDSESGFSLSFDPKISWKMKPSQSKSIFVDIKSYCEISDNFEFNWELLSQDKTLSEEFWEVQTIPSRLYIPPNSVTVGEYNFRVSATDLENSVTGSTQLTLTVIGSSLVPIISTEKTTWNVDAVNSLDASASYDPDEPQGSLNFAWTCQGPTGECTSLIEDSGAEVVRVPSGSLATGGYYAFTVTISKDTRTASSDAFVDTVSYMVPKVDFDPIEEPVNVQKKLTIVATVDGPDSYTYSWDKTLGGSYALISTEPTKKLTIASNSLQQNTRYQFTLTLNSTNGDISNHAVAFETGSVPSGGSLSVVPTSGTDYTTDFVLTASSWSHTDTLTYQFGYILEDKTFFLNRRNESASFVTRFPKGSFTLFVKVYDENTQFGYATTSVTVGSSPEDHSQDVVTEFKKKLDIAHENPDEFPAYVSMINEYVISPSTVSSELKQEAFDACMRGISKVRENLFQPEAPDIELLLQMLDATTGDKSMHSSGNEDSVFSELSTTLALSREAEISVDQSQANYYASILENSLNLDSTTMTEDPNKVVSASTMLSEVATLTDLSPGESFSFESPNIRGQSSSLSGNALGEFSVPSSMEGSAELPSSLDLGDSDITISYTEFGSLTNSGGIAAADLSLYDLESGTDPLTITLDSSNVELQIPVSAGSSPQCVYWTDLGWSTEGCSLDRVEDDMAICLCSHLSLFAAGSDLATVGSTESSGDSKSFTFNSLIIYVYGLLVVWVVSTIVLKKVDAKQVSVLQRNPKKTLDLTIEELDNSFTKKRDVDEMSRITDEILVPVKDTTKVSKTPQIAPTDRTATRKTGGQNPSQPQQRRRNPGASATKIPTEAPSPQKTSPGKVAPSNRAPERRQKASEDSPALKKGQEPQLADELFTRPQTASAALNLWAAHAYISLCVTDPRYTLAMRATRVLLSLLLQAALIGSVLHAVSSSSSASSVMAGMKSLNFTEIAVAIAGLCASSLIVGGVMTCLMQNADNHDERAKATVLKRVQFKKRVGTALCVVLAIIALITANVVNYQASDEFATIWLAACLLGGIADCFVLQLLCVLIRALGSRWSMRKAVKPMTAEDPVD